MKASIRWISEILDSDVDAGRVAERLTQAGVEIEDVLETAVPDTGVVVARILEREAHPSRDRLFVVKVDDGEGTHQVVCGAPNTPGPGALVVLARPGSVVGGRSLEAREIAGMASHGMLVSEAELDIGPDADGILILEETLDVGRPLRQCYELDDRILEFTITPNRPDCLGHVGLAREVAAVLGLTFRRPQPDLSADEMETQAEELARIRIDDATGCPRYAAAVVQGVRVRPSPLPLRNRLHVLGVRPISNIVDVTNWILLRDNQPLHAFDRTLLPGGEIIVRRAAAGETIFTLDEVERTLVPEDLVIASRDRSVAVAGVMGGEGTMIGDTTSDVLIECAYFDPRTIRRTSARLKLQTESSYRFERGTDPSLLDEVVRHAATMMVRLGGGRVARSVVDVYPERIPPARIGFRVERAGRIVGRGFTADRCREHLLRLGCTVESGDESFVVVAPLHRPDLTREIDLIEEVARLEGYDAIPSTHPLVQAAHPERASYDLVLKLKRALASTGLDEVVSLSFAHSVRLEELGIPGKPVALANPLGSDRDVMRTSLVPGLLDLLARHVHRNRTGLRVFEVGNVFLAGDGGLVPGVVEQRRAAGLVYGPRPGWVGEDRGQSDFHDAWGAVFHALRDLWDIEVDVRRMDDPLPWLHPRSACHVVAGTEEVGWVGELHPRIARPLDLPVDHDGMPRTVGLFDFEVTGIPARLPSHRPFSDMPASERDVAMVFPEEVEARAILDVAGRIAGDLMEDVKVFDVFRGGSIPKGSKSVAFRIVLRSASRTLRQEEVDELMARLVSDLSRTLGGRMRDTSAS